MSVFHRGIAMKRALNFICRGVSPSSSSGFRSIPIPGGVSIPRPPRSSPHVFFRGFSAIPTNQQDGSNERHWFIVMEDPAANASRDEIIDYYIKTLATVLGSEEEARRKIYSVSTKHYYAFGCLISEELSRKLEPLPNVNWVLPHSYSDPHKKTFGGEPFINGQAVPYDPKYHEEWVRNNGRRNERRSSDRNRSADGSRNFERRREMRQNAYQRPPTNSTDHQALQGNTFQGAPDSQDRSN